MNYDVRQEPARTHIRTPATVDESEDWPSARENVPLLKENGVHSPNNKKSDSTDAFTRDIRRHLAIKEKP